MPAKKRSRKWIPKDLKAGVFSAAARRAGMTVPQYARKVLAKGSKASETTKKRARLAQTFKKMRTRRRRSSK